MYCSTAFALCLHRETSQPHLPAAQIETRRRMMWACFCLDSLMAGETTEMCMIPLSAVHIQTPSNERVFELGIPPSASVQGSGSSIDSAPNPNDGVFAKYVRILILRKRILE